MPTDQSIPLNDRQRILPLGYLVQLNKSKANPIGVPPGFLLSLRMKAELFARIRLSAASEEDERTARRNRVRTSTRTLKTPHINFATGVRLDIHEKSARLRNRLLSDRSLKELFADHTSRRPDWLYPNPASYEELLGCRLANTGNPCQARQPVWRPCRAAHPR